MRTNVLVIALDSAMPAEIRNAEIFVVAPALNSRLKHWLSDERHARRAAEDRLATCLARLERSGTHAKGSVGDPIRCRRLPTRWCRSPPTRS